jgi:hypothetical protein
MISTKYIGMDVHKESISIAVRKWEEKFQYISRISVVEIREQLGGNLCA